MAFKLDRDRVRLVLVQGERELLRASLPPPAARRAASTCVAASIDPADPPEASFLQNLQDDV